MSTSQGKLTTAGVAAVLACATTIASCAVESDSISVVKGHFFLAP